MGLVAAPHRRAEPKTTYVDSLSGSFPHTGNVGQSPPLDKHTVPIRLASNLCFLPRRLRSIPTQSFLSRALHGSAILRPRRSVRAIRLRTLVIVGVCVYRLHVGDSIRFGRMASISAGDHVGGLPASNVDGCLTWMGEVISISRMLAVLCQAVGFVFGLLGRGHSMRGAEGGSNSGSFAVPVPCVVALGVVPWGPWGNPSLARVGASRALVTCARVCAAAHWLGGMGGLWPPVTRPCGPQRRPPFASTLS